jgi:hypothetical protein
VTWQLLCLSRGGFEGGLAGVRLLFIHYFEGLADGGVWAAQGSAWRRPIGTSSHNAGGGFTAFGNVAQGRGWPRRAGGDGGDVLRSPCVTAPSWAIARSAAVRLSRVSQTP